MSTDILKVRPTEAAQPAPAGFNDLLSGESLKVAKRGELYIVLTELQPRVDFDEGLLHGETGKGENYLIPINSDKIALCSNAVCSYLGTDEDRQNEDYLQRAIRVTTGESGENRYELVATWATPDKNHQDSLAMDLNSRAMKAQAAIKQKAATIARDMLQFADEGKTKARFNFQLSHAADINAINSASSERNDIVKLLDSEALIAFLAAREIIGNLDSIVFDATTQGGTPILEMTIYWKDRDVKDLPAEHLLQRCHSKAEEAKKAGTSINKQTKDAALETIAPIQPMAYDATWANKMRIKINELHSNEIGGFTPFTLFTCRADAFIPPINSPGAIPSGLIALRKKLLVSHDGNLEYVKMWKNNDIRDIIGLVQEIGLTVLFKPIISSSGGIDQFEVQVAPPKNVVFTEVKVLDKDTAGLDEGIQTALKATFKRKPTIAPNLRNEPVSTAEDVLRLMSQADPSHPIFFLINHTLGLDDEFSGEQDYHKVFSNDKFPHTLDSSMWLDIFVQPCPTGDALRNFGLYLFKQPLSALDTNGKYEYFVSLNNILLQKLRNLRNLPIVLQP